MILVVGYFWFSFHDIHVRYRLTVEVQDGDQIKTGSSVVEASYNIPSGWIWAGPSTYVRKFGYAPTVDLGEKGLLFLTFVNATRTPEQSREYNAQFSCGFDDIGCLPFAAYRKPGVSRDFDRRKAALNELRRQSGPRDVPFAVLPKLVRFRDINDPHTLAVVSPDDLAASFGPGVELKRVILQLTDDPITRRPENWPQWLKENGHFDDAILKGYQNDGCNLCHRYGCRLCDGRVSARSRRRCALGENYGDSALNFSTASCRPPLRRIKSIKCTVTVISTTRS